MGRPLADIIRDTDEILTRRTAGTEKLASEGESILRDEDVFKLAEKIRRRPEPVEAEKNAEEEGELSFTMREKLAHAVALIDTLLNLPALTKLAEFEEKAKANGFADEEIRSHFEKNAGVKFRSILSEMPWLIES
jgi:hypothetical protein